jgi:hypothetical protein
MPLLSDIFELNCSINSKWAIFFIVPLNHSVSDIGSYRRFDVAQCF